MKLGQQYKIEEVASKDKNRLALQYPHIQKTDDGKFVAVATNGSAMACVPVEDAEPGEVGPVPIEAMKRSRKGRNLGVVVLSASADKQAKTLDGTSNAIPTDLPPYPAWQQVVPPKDMKVMLKVGLNAKMLLEVAHAIGSDGPVTLEFQDGLSPIRVTREGDKDAFGVIMPLRAS